MATIDDQAADQEQFIRDCELKARKKTLPNIGRCHWCSEEIKVGCFCSSDCRDDYEKSERLKNNI